MRFLLSRRWLLFALVVVGGAWGASLLGQWQFHRLDERRAENRLVARNLDAPPVSIDDLLAVGRPAAEEHEWREVVVHGTWDDAHTIVVKYQTRDGAPGVDVVTPLRTDSGAAILVDRGWLGTQNSGSARPELPPATPGEVTVVGWVRVDGSGGSTTVSDLATRAVSSAAAAKVVSGEARFGVLVCGTGIGISIAANRDPRIRCALVHDTTTAHLAREHNDANMIAFGGRIISEDVALDALRAFLAAKYEGGRHAKRVAKLGEQLEPIG